MNAVLAGCIRKNGNNNNNRQVQRTVRMYDMYPRVNVNNVILTWLCDVQMCSDRRSVFACVQCVVGYAETMGRNTRC